MSSSFALHILVVNDDPFQKTTLVQYLKRNGFPYCTGLDEIDALRHYESRDALIAILDIDLGKQNSAYVRYPTLAQLGNLRGAIVYSSYPDDITHSVYQLLCSAGLKSVFKLSKSRPLDELLNLVRQIARSDDTSHPARCGSMVLSAEAEMTITPRYQPQFDAQAGQLCGFEVLGRIRDTQGKTHPPAEFLSHLVDSGSITRFTRRLIETAIGEVQSRISDPIALSFNIDYLSLEEETFSDSILEQITSLNYPLNLITLEVTETGFSRSAFTFKNLIQFRLAGVNISIDDFDFEQATINEFLAFPFNEAKFDKSLIKRSATDSKLHELLSSFCNTCKKLNITIVIEGIETQEELQRARTLGADKIQGYLYYPPLTIEQAAEII